MITNIAALLSGLVFGLGLILSGMGNPAKVQNFLDFFGQWDPSLALVMGGAIAVGLLGFALVRKRSTSVLGEPMQMPTRKDIDAPLVVGASLFGIGWGLAGYCPGPALVGVTAGIPSALIFTVAMLAGMIAFGWWQASKSKSA